MNASPIGRAYGTEDEILRAAHRSAQVTHDHPEGIKGAQAVALAVLLARHGADKETLRSRIEASFGYDLHRTVAAIRPRYTFDVSCKGSVPEALVAFLDSTSFEDAVRNAVSLGGDSDTQACIAGAVAEAHYGGVPAELRRRVEERLPPDMLGVVRRFEARFPLRGAQP